MCIPVTTETNFLCPCGLCVIPRPRIFVIMRREGLLAPVLNTRCRTIGSQSTTRTCKPFVKDKVQAHVCRPYHYSLAMNVLHCSREALLTHLENCCGREQRIQGPQRTTVSPQGRRYWRTHSVPRRGGGLLLSTTTTRVDQVEKP